jgi:hypothetical protein
MYVKDDDEWKKDKNHKLCKETFDKLRHKQRENFLRNQKYNETKAIPLAVGGLRGHAP